MGDRPILFMDSMVRAILDGQKTVTRRTGTSWARARPGDRLWVREAHALVYACCWPDLPHTRGPDRDGCPCFAFYREGFDRSAPRWRPSIYMPRWACRLHLLVEDAAWDPTPLGLDDAEATREGFADAEAFRALWREMHPQGGGAWRIAFRRTDGAD